MFVIATSGRCGTEAICTGLDRFSDHDVEHEPSPPLQEAYLKHHGEDYETAAMAGWRQRLAARDDDRWGLSWRAPNLLDDLRAAAPTAPVLIIVRDPNEYVVSAHSKRVLSKGTAWDRLRLMPPARWLADSTLTQRIAWHWRITNDLLLDFAGRDPATRVAILSDLDVAVDDWCRHFGVNVVDRPGLSGYLAQRPNAMSRDTAPPEGFAREPVAEICARTWDRARAAAKAYARP